MSSRCPKRWSRVLVLAWALPLFLLGPVLNGRTFLWHTHDDADAHLHVLAEHEHAPHAEAPHAAALAHEHHGDAPPAPSEHRESDCFLVCFSGPFQAPARGAPAQRVHLAALQPQPPLALRLESPPGADGRAPWCQRVKQRSGVAALAATTRALRI